MHLPMLHCVRKALSTLWSRLRGQASELPLTQPPPPPDGEPTYKLPAEAAPSAADDAQPESTRPRSLTVAVMASENAGETREPAPQPSAPPPGTPVSDPDAPSEPEPVSPDRATVAPIAVSADEGIAIAVAVLSIGLVLLWSTRDSRRLEPALPAITQGLPTPAIDATAAPDPVVGDRSWGRLGTPAPDAPLQSVEQPFTATSQAAAAVDLFQAAAAPSQTAAQLLSVSELGAIAQTNLGLSTIPAEIVAVLATPADVPADHWAYPFVQRLAIAGRLPESLSTTLQPAATLTRAQLAQLLSQILVPAASPAEGGPVSRFQDVPPDAEAAAAIERVAAAGFLVGYPDDRFRPDQPATRQEVLVGLVSGLGRSPDNAPPVDLSGFADADAPAAWARSRLAVAAADGLMVNYPNPAEMRPQAAATRAEAIAMFYQALVLQGQLVPLESPYVVSEVPEPEPGANAN